MTKKEIKVFTVRVSYGTWFYEYKMGACDGCSAVSKALSVWGERMRVSARPFKRKSPPENSTS